MFYYILEEKYNHLWSSFDEEDKGADLVVIKGKRKRYIPMKFERNNANYKWDDEVNRLLENILSGTGSFKSMHKKLNMFNTEDKDDL